MQESQSIEKKIPKAIFIVQFIIFSKMYRKYPKNKDLRIYLQVLINNIININL